MTRQEKDHERYLREKEKRLLRQSLYYRSHKEEVKRKVKECKRKRDERLREKLLQNE